uniref:PPM-type phosphatase domain-containing protein n=1 Tax=Rhizophora mucronata TaxID=61149 RepID=A0A2P2MKQ3_RHIMU
MSGHSSIAGASRTHRRTTFLDMIKSAACLNSSSPDSGKGKSKSSGKRMSHGFHLVEGKSGHKMEDYHVAEYCMKKNHELGLFAIFDGHLGDSVPSYLRDSLFNNILEEVIFIPISSNTPAPTPSHPKKQKNPHTITFSKKNFLYNHLYHFVPCSQISGMIQQQQ